MNTQHSTRAGWRNLLLVLGLLAALAHAQVVNTPNLNLSEDTDQDGISNADEVALGLDPYNPYNGISILDGAAFIVAWERYLGASSSTVDTDGDGWSDFDEVMVYQTNLFDERSLPGPISNLSAATTSQPVATSTTAATPSTSLIQNGDFSKTNISTWIDGKKLKGYNGSGFEWAAGSVEGWSAYAGSTIEVWNTGTRVVELNGDKSNYGIQQKVETAKPGAYLLTWRSLGRTQEAAPAKNKKTPPAPDNSYFVQVQVGEGSGGRAIKTEKFTAGGDGVLVFQLSENDLTAANGKGIYIAFIPTNGSNSYGSLISGVNLVPVEVDIRQPESTPPILLASLGAAPAAAAAAPGSGSIGNPAQDDDFAVVSNGTDNDLASELVINLPSGAATGTVTVNLKMKGSDGSLKFEQNSVSITPGTPKVVKIWGTTASSGENKSKIEIELVMSGGGKSTIEEDLTIIDGVKISFEGTFYSPVDSRAEGWRPSLIRGDDPAAIAADASDYSSKISFTDGDQPVGYRAWSPKPKVTVSKVEVLKPPMELKNDPLKGAEVHMTSGKFESHKSGTEKIEHPNLVFKTGSATAQAFFTTSIVSRADDTPIKMKYHEIKDAVMLETRILDAIKGGNVLAEWLLKMKWIDFLEDELGTGLADWSNQNFNAAKGAQLSKSIGAKAVLGAQDMRGANKTKVEWKMHHWDGWTLSGQVTDARLETP